MEILFWYIWLRCSIRGELDCAAILWLYQDKYSVQNELQYEKIEMLTEHKGLRRLTGTRSPDGKENIESNGMYLVLDCTWSDKRKYPEYCWDRLLKKWLENCSSIKLLKIHKCKKSLLLNLQSVHKGCEKSINLITLSGKLAIKSLLGLQHLPKNRLI